ncbi:MAG: chemotaxis protein CheB [Planctomycetota bacterium]
MTPRDKKKAAPRKPVSRQDPGEAARKTAGGEGTSGARRKKVAAPRKANSTIEIPPGFPIVGIGASAGGLEALETFFKAMPADTGTGFVVVVHLDPKHVSILPELLQRHTKMSVRKIEDGMRIQRDSVYVIPPNKSLSILHGTLHLLDLVEPRGSNLPIDSFLRSLAQDQARNAVCIILSGTGTDGTLGVKAIKSALGMVMVQNEASAKYGGMPRSALGTGLVDYELPPEQMPEQLLLYTRHREQQPAPMLVSADGSLPPQALQKIYVLLRARTSHDFSLYKRNTICRRIERRMNVHQIEEIEDYVRYLQKSDRETDILFKELLISVTSFFRDPEAFTILQQEILPELLEGNSADSSFRVWVPGCASGEEAYSVAISLHECMEKIDHRCHVQIFGTDIDEDAVSAARSGRYPESIRADVGHERIQRYFTREDDGQYRVKEMIREMLVFAPQSIIKDPPFTKLDLLCCRNLLIYLGPELQQRLRSVFHYSLRPGGILFLGSSEAIGTATDLFSALHKKWKIYRCQPVPAAHQAMPDLPARARIHEARDPADPHPVQRVEEVGALQLVETILQQSNTSPCAIINGACDVIYIHGRTGKYLEPAEGKASVNILEMARPGLRKELTAAIRRVAVHKQEVECRGLRVYSNWGHFFLNLRVRPVLEQAATRDLMMVVFEETTVQEKKQGPEIKPGARQRKEKTVEKLEQELQHTRETLQTTIEELETSNEELKSANEELQSTNEESSTVNAELQARIDELTRANDDMRNLLDSTEIATLFLDIELRVSRFTPTATRIIPLASTDVGRPVGHFASGLIDTDLARYSRLVLDDLVMREAEVEKRMGAASS